MDNNNFKENPEQYKKCARVHLTQEAPKVGDEFLNDILALREKHGISDVVMVFQIHTPDGVSQRYGFAGASQNELSLARACEDTALLKTVSSIENLAYSDGFKAGVQATQDLLNLREKEENVQTKAE